MRSVCLLLCVVMVFAAAEALAQRILVDHRDVALFEHIPSEYAAAAAQLRLLFMDRSVGGNINDALSCLSFPHAQAPNSCKRHAHRDERYAVDPSEVFWEGTWDRSRWRYEFWPEGCSEDPICFIDFIEPRIDSFDVVGYQFSYLAVMPGAKIADPSVGFFAPGGSGGKAADYAAFEARHPGKTVLWWTTSLARGIGTPEARDFNDAMRSHARAHDLVLFDVADILSHDPMGNPCFDNRDGVEYLTENHPDDGLDLPAICPQYTTETEGGHLGSISAGGIRVAKAFWVLMARIAGWDGVVSDVQSPMFASSQPLRILDVAPQPARENVTIRFVTDGETQVRVQLSDLLGRPVSEAVTLHVRPGIVQDFRFPVHGLAPGSYLLILSTPGTLLSRRVTLLR